MRSWLFLSIATLSGAELLQRVLFSSEVAAAYPAVCLDGSPAGYYINEKANSTGWVIYLEGGGLCVTPIDCKSRAKGNEGSSKGWSSTFTDTTNVLAGSDDGNPFGDFSHVWVPYCSGDTYTGTTLRNRFLGDLATTGHTTLIAVLDHLYNTTSLGRATQLLFSGGSAGGIGVWHNADFVASHLRETLGIGALDVRASPQAGYFFPRGVCNFETFAAGSRVPFDFLASAVVHTLEGGFVNPACAAAEAKTARCWDVGVVSSYVQLPMFVAQNAVDQNQANAELLCPPGVCGPAPKLRVAREWQSDYANKSRASMAAYLRTHPASAVFMPACFDHTGDLCMDRGPTVGGTTYAQALREWFFDGKHQGALLVDACPDGEPTCNPTCGKGGCGDSVAAWASAAAPSFAVVEGVE